MAAGIVPAGKAVEAVAKGLTGDFLVIDGQIFRQVETKERVPTGGLTPTGRAAMHTVTRVELEPVNVEAHVNPISILASAGLVGVGVLAATFAWHGLSLPGPLGPITFVQGLKETGLGKDLNEAYERWKIRRRIRASGGIFRESRVVGSREEAQKLIMDEIGNAECQVLNREWQAARRGTANRAPDPEQAAKFLAQARDKNCPWVDQI